MPGICIITGGHLCRNPRVVKEANVLADGGYEVTVLGPLLSDELVALDAGLTAGRKWQHIPSVDLRKKLGNGLNRTRLRAARRIGSEVVRLAGLSAACALGYGVKETYDLAKRRKHDLYIGHQEVGAWVACELAKDGRRVGADFEDWYSRDLLPEAQSTRPLRLLRECEGVLLRGARHVTTTSGAMASALASNYKSKKPVPVYNAFPWADRAGLDNQVKDRVNASLPSVHWFSQTIGRGRGLELLCAALRHVDIPIAVHLRGSYSPEIESWLRSLFPGERAHALTLHEQVAPQDLLSRVSEHDIGLALEMRTPDNKNYTVSNKIFQYLLGGVAVVATNTAGQREIACAAPEAVRLCDDRDARTLAGALNALLRDSRALAVAKRAALNASEKELCWEKQATVLLDSVRAALN